MEEGVEGRGEEGLGWSVEEKEDFEGSSFDFLPYLNLLFLNLSFRAFLCLSAAGAALPTLAFAFSPFFGGLVGAKEAGGEGVVVTSEVAEASDFTSNPVNASRVTRGVGTKEGVVDSVGDSTSASLTSSLTSSSISFSSAAALEGLNKLFKLPALKRSSFLRGLRKGRREKPPMDLMEVARGVITVVV